MILKIPVSRLKQDNFKVSNFPMNFSSIERAIFPLLNSSNNSFFEVIFLVILLFDDFKAKFTSLTETVTFLSLTFLSIPILKSIEKLIRGRMNRIEHRNFFIIEQYGNKIIR